MVPGPSSIAPFPPTIASLNQFEELDNKNREYPFKGILLATSEDQGIIDYFLKFGTELNELTGGTLLLFVLKELQKAAPSYQAPGYVVGVEALPEMLQRSGDRTGSPLLQRLQS